MLPVIFEGVDFKIKVALPVLGVYLEYTLCSFPLKYRIILEKRNFPLWKKIKYRTFTFYQ